MKYRSPFDRRRILLERLKILYPLISLPILSVIDFLDGRLAADFDKASSVDRTGSTLSSSPHTEELESTLHLVSRPPPWCQDVCALLNKKTSNNWKTVAQRLAYRCVSLISCLLGGMITVWPISAQTRSGCGRLNTIRVPGSSMTSTRSTRARKRLGSFCGS